MNSISSSTDLLRNTYSLVHLARETAFAQGKLEQAERLSPIVDDLKKIVDVSKDTGKTSATSSTMKQSDFQALLKAVEASTNSENGEQMSIKDRNSVVLAMAAGGMQDLDIARQMGMTRDEVKTLMQLDNLSKNTTTGRYSND